MDPSLVHALAEVIGPLLGLLGVAAIPASLMFITKYFKLKTRELELEAELHGRAAQARIQALETRQAAVESALQSLLQPMLQRNDLAAHAALLESPPTDARPEPAPRALVSIKPQG